jgi:predicted nucleic acid-binding protein
MNILNNSRNPNLNIKLFLDTNLLVYLVDNTYPSFTAFIDFATKSPIFDLISSRIVLYEFIGIRKREHYLRNVAKKSQESSPNGQLNFSSLTNHKYINQYSAPEVDFFDIVQDIEKSVRDEEEKILNNYGIVFDDNIVFNEQLGPVFDICLSSRISHNDCWVTISGVFPNIGNTIDNLFFLTNDESLVDYYNQAQQNLSNIFSKHQLPAPNLFLIGGNNPFLGQGCNLKNKIDIDSLKDTIIKKVLEILKERNPGCYLGKTFMPQQLPDGCISFKLDNNENLPTDVYVTIIGKDFDFIYTATNKIDYFWNNGSQITNEVVLPPIPEDGSRHNISFKVLSKDETNTVKAIPKEVVDILRADGNYVFVYPE